MNNITTEKYRLLSLADLGKTKNSIVESVGKSFELDEPTEYSIKLVLSELIINGFIHGNHQSKEIDLELIINKEESTIELIIDDGGDGFDVEHSVKEPNVESEQGRGLILVRAFSHNVVYNNVGNRVSATITL